MRLILLSVLKHTWVAHTHSHRHTHPRTKSPPPERAGFLRLVAALLLHSIREASQ